MAWVRIHDGAMGNLKILRLSDSAFRLWVKGLSYCQTHLTDGLLPREWLHEVRAKRGDVDMLSTPLVEGKAPLWERIDGFGFKCHDYLVWNDCREKVMERQDAAKQRKTDYEAKKKAERVARRAGADTIGTRSERVLNTVRNASENASITKPNQTIQEELRTHTRRAAAPPLMGNEHRAHAECGRVCVPAFLHRQFKDSLGGDEQAADARLRTWYGRVLDSLTDDEAVASDAPKFWRPLFDAEFVKTVKAERDYEAEKRAEVARLDELLKIGRPA